MKAMRLLVVATFLVGVFSQSIQLTDLVPVASQFMDNNGASAGQGAYDAQPNGSTWDCYCDGTPGNFLQFEGNGLFEINRIGIRGRNPTSAKGVPHANWVETFRLATSTNGVDWTNVESTLSTGVTSAREPDSAVFVELKPFTARFVRFIIVKANTWACARVGFFGKVVSTLPLGEPLGLSSFKIEDHAISASSSFWTGENACAPQYGRLKSNQGAGSWCAQFNTVGQFLEVSLGGVSQINSIQTQGRNPHSQLYRGALQWVTGYRMMYSMDGVSWLPYTVENAPFQFTGNYDADSVVTHVLPTPVQARFLRLVVQGWFGHISMRAEILGKVISKDEIGSPLGLENGKISDSFISASSTYPCAGCCDPENSRLNGARGAGAWCAAANDANQWIQADLPGLCKVTAVAVQARNMNSESHAGAKQWVTSFNLLVSMDGSNWSPIEEKGAPRVFRGNLDWTTTVTSAIIGGVNAKYIRLVPLGFNSHISLRWELYGEVLEPRELGPALGLSTGAISDGQLTASSTYPGDLGIYDPTNGRLNGKAGVGAWCAAANNENQWFQVDLQGAVHITGIATQGRNPKSDAVPHDGQWITSYYLEGSPDGVTWAAYTRGDERIVFGGNHDATTARVHVIDPPLYARYVRFRPLSWSQHISARFEIYGSRLTRETVGPALGLEGGGLPSSAFSCSDTYGGTWSANFGVINSDGAWIPRPLNLDQWWQVNLGRPVEVGGIGTQGRPQVLQWVTKYWVQYTRDPTCANGWEFVQEGGGTRTFQGNANFKTVVTRAFKSPVVAHCIRVLPREWNGHIAMRFELYRPDLARRPVLQNIGIPLGVQEGKLALSASSSSSAAADGDCSAAAGRLRGPNGWCAKTDNKNLDNWLEVDLGAVIEVGGVATQGYASPDESKLQWVTSYTLLLSNDTQTWTEYSEFGMPREFRGNLDPSTSVQHSLVEPLPARYVRFVTKGAYARAAMRVEVYNTGREEIAKKKALQDALNKKEAEEAQREAALRIKEAKEQEAARAAIAADRAAAQAALERRKQAELAAAEDLRNVKAVEEARRAAVAEAAKATATAAQKQAAAEAEANAAREQAKLAAARAEAAEAALAQQNARSRARTEAADAIVAKSKIEAEAAAIRKTMGSLEEERKTAAFVDDRYRNALRKINSLEEMIRAMRIGKLRIEQNLDASRVGSSSKDADVAKLREEITKWKTDCLKYQKMVEDLKSAAEAAKKLGEEQKQLVAANAIKRELSEGITGKVAGSDATAFTVPDNFPMPEKNAGKEDRNEIVPSITRGDVTAAQQLLKK